MTRSYLLATRGSPLALRQTRIVVAALRRRFPQCRFDLRIVRTTGDRVGLGPGRSTGVFVSELQKGLVERQFDMAVHSLKDLPTAPVPGLCLGACLRREDPRDAYLSPDPRPLSRVPPGWRIGTGSLRRRAFLLASFPQLRIEPVRGNVGTRLQKLFDPANGLHGLILASAGLQRLYGNRPPCRVRLLPVAILPPAPGQGVIAIECRENDPNVRSILMAIHHRATHACATAERSILAAMHGGCNVPLGAFAEIRNGRLHLDCAIASLDGKTLLRARSSGSPDRIEAVVERVQKSLVRRGAMKILQEARAALR